MAEIPAQGEIPRFCVELPKIPLNPHERQTLQGSETLFAQLFLANIYKTRNIVQS